MPAVIEPLHACSAGQEANGGADPVQRLFLAEGIRRPPNKTRTLGASYGQNSTEVWNRNRRGKNVAGNATGSAKKLDEQGPLFL